MIDEKLLLEEIEKSMMDNPHTDGKIRMNHMAEHRHFAMMVNRQPKIVEWIFCEEQLPEEVGNYIIHAKTGSDEDYVGMWLYERGANLSGKQTYIDDKQGYWANAWSGDPISEGLSRNCAAWQPLPEAYKG